MEAQQQVVVFGDSLSNNADVGLATNLQLRTKYVRTAVLFCRHIHAAAATVYYPRYHKCI